MSVERLTDEQLRAVARCFTEQSVEAAAVNEAIALRARVAKLEAALSGLVCRLDQIHDDPAYKSVWTVHQLHVGPYQGPTYVDALAVARAALEGAPQ